MPFYLIDANLPYYFSLWNTKDFVFVKDLGDNWKDEQIWDYAIDNKLIIITKDADFFDRVAVSNLHPGIIHICFGNMLMKDFFSLMTNVWPQIENLNEQYELLKVYKDKIVIIK